MKKAIGEKFAQIVFAVGMTFSGLILGFYSGWSLALAMCLIGPFIAIGFTLFSKTMGETFSVVQTSYGQSAGYAEQALSAIKVVIANGNELIEVKNYCKFLEYARSATIRQGMKMALFFGFLIFCINGSYAYAFIIGSIWVD